MNEYYKVIVKDSYKWPEIGGRIQKERKKLKITQEKMCGLLYERNVKSKAKAGLSGDMISRIENGNDMPDYVHDIINIICEKSDVRRDYLYCIDNFRTNADCEHVTLGMAEYEKNKELLSFLKTLGFEMEYGIFAGLSPTQETMNWLSSSLTDNSRKAFEMCIENNLCVHGADQRMNEAAQKIESLYPGDFHYAVFDLVTADKKHFTNILYYFRLKEKAPVWIVDKNADNVRLSAKNKNKPIAALRYRISYNGKQVFSWKEKPCYDLFNGITGMSKSLLDNYDFGKLIE